MLSAILIQVFFTSSKLLCRSGTDKHNALFCFEASMLQLLIPTKLTPFIFPSKSKWLCKAFKGLCFDLSANPNSSNNIIEIGKLSGLYFSFNAFNLPSAIWKIPSTSPGVVESEP